MDYCHSLSDISFYRYTPKITYQHWTFKNHNWHAFRFLCLQRGTSSTGNALKLCDRIGKKGIGQVLSKNLKSYSTKEEAGNRATEKCFNFVFMQVKLDYSTSMLYGSFRTCTKLSNDIQYQADNGG